MGNPVSVTCRSRRYKCTNQLSDNQCQHRQPSSGGVVENFLKFMEINTALFIHVCAAGDEQVLLHFLNVLSRLKISLIKVSKRILSINQFLGFFYETRSVHCDVWKVSSRERDKKKVKPNKSSPLRRISGTHDWV